MPRDTDTLADLVARVDLPELVAHLGGVPARGAAGRKAFHCPHPAHDDSAPSFAVRTTTTGRQVYKCYACNAGGDALDLVQWLTGGTKGDAARYLRQWLGIDDTPAGRRRDTRRPAGARVADTRNDTPPATPPPSPRLPADTRRPGDAVADRVLADYCRSRGWPASAVDRFGLSAVVDGAGMVRIRHPFYVPGPDGPVLATWQDRATRAVAKGKYHAAPKRHVPLFGLCDLDRPEVTRAVICEGPPDAITARLVLDDDPTVAAVGVPGASYWQAAYAGMFAGLSVLIVPDADDPGTELAATIANDLKGHAACAHTLTIGGVKDLTEYVAAAGAESMAAIFRDAWSQCRSCAALCRPATTPAEPSRCAVCGADTVPTRNLCLACIAAEGGGRHRWRQCAGCGALALTDTDRRCYLTPDCEGRFAPIQPAGVAS